jgi:poly-gamma-glutamate synthesis protein (capsule biosynthesis protein)
MPVKFCCLGDVMPGENHYHYGRGIRTLYGKRYNELIKQEVKDILFNKSDYIFFNFEYSLVKDASELNGVKNSIYRAPVESLDIFPQGIKKIVNIANNHFSQHGRESARYTKKVLEDKGYLVAGEDNKPVIINENNRIIKIWGVSLIKDVYYCGEYFFSDYNSLLPALNAGAKAENESRVIAIHWGDEYITKPSEKQIKLAYKLADAGFDLIAGHHPHVVQPVEKYKQSVIIYSMGNFIFDQNFSSLTSKGLAVHVNIGKETHLTGSYTTVQEKYRVAGIQNYEEPLFTGKTYPDYRKKLKKASLLMRLLMKLELLLHLPQVHSGTIKFLLNR